LKRPINTRRPEEIDKTAREKETSSFHDLALHNKTCKGGNGIPGSHRNLCHLGIDKAKMALVTEAFYWELPGSFYLECPSFKPSQDILNN